MILNKKYDLLIIGGGISSCVFASNYVKDKFQDKIGIIEYGRGLGGRSSTRFSKRFKGWKLDHGSPNLNLCFEKNNLLKEFLDELLKNKFIKFDDSELIQLGNNLKKDLRDNLDFSIGNCFLSSSSMRKLSQNIVLFNDKRNQIDFYFETLVSDLEFKENQWILTSQNGDRFISKYVICSSNLLLHKRSMEILNKNYIPLRKAIPKGEDETIDKLLNILDKQLYIPRLTFLIYTKENYFYKDDYSKKNRYFILKEDLEKKYKFERVVFQLQENNKLGIVIHSKSSEYVNDYLFQNNDNKIKEEVFISFNQLFKANPIINQLTGNEDMSIMRWKASQPFGEAVPLTLQFCRKYNIGFCGDWFEGQGFGRIEGAIWSALKLSEKFKTLK